MKRPSCKKDLLELSQRKFDELLMLIESYPEPGEEFSTPTMNRNIRDVAGHLHAWHRMLLGWYNDALNGIKPEMPAKGYKWSQTPELNRKIWQEYSNKAHRDVMDMLKKSHNEIMQLIGNYSNEELFEKKRFSWTGGTSLGAYLVSSGSSHYDWAIKLIKKGLKHLAVKTILS